MKRSFNRHIFLIFGSFCQIFICIGNMLISIYLERCEGDPAAVVAAGEGGEGPGGAGVPRSAGDVAPLPGLGVTSLIGRKI